MKNLPLTKTHASYLLLAMTDNDQVQVRGPMQSRYMGQCADGLSDLYDAEDHPAAHVAEGQWRLEYPGDSLTVLALDDAAFSLLQQFWATFRRDRFLRGPFARAQRAVVAEIDTIMDDVAAGRVPMLTGDSRVPLKALPTEGNKQE